MTESSQRARLSNLSRSIADRVAIVTGAASGMGRATAFLFADEGAKVAVVDIGEDRVDAVVKQILDAGGEAHGWVCDVSDPAQIHEMVSEVAERFGGVDILVNNAGISRRGGAERGRIRIRSGLGRDGGREPDRPRPAHPGRPATPPGEPRGPRGEYRIDRSDRHDRRICPPTRPPRPVCSGSPGPSRSSSAAKGSR